MKSRERKKYYRAFLEITNRRTKQWRPRTIFVQSPLDADPIDNVLTIVKKIKGAKYRKIDQISRDEYIKGVSRSPA